MNIKAHLINQFIYLFAQGCYLVVQYTLSLIFTDQAIYKVHLHSSCQSIQSKDIPKCLNISNYTFDLFCHSCIIAGCSYSESLPGVGIKRADNLMKKVAAAANGDVSEVWNF